MPELPAARHGVVFERDGVRVHTFTAPEDFLSNSTHIIETEHSLVIVDGQFVVPYATAFRRYADGLGKPIAKVFLSHAHVDHFFGLGAAFTDVPIAAPAAAITVLRERGEAMRAERAKQYGPMVPDRVVIPQEAVAPGVEVIDGLKYELDVIGTAECDAQLVITLADFGVTVVQDLVYSGAHLYVTRDSEHWMTVLRGLIDSPAELFLAGHGPVAGKAELQHNIDYLAYARQTFAATHDPAQYKVDLLTTFPHRTGAAILDIYVPRLYATPDGSQA
jgi:glyoxylase-like metal-dependent hydrolase (beta-lactamase superfamily II)